MPVKVVRTDKRKPGNGWWSDKERYQAVSTYLVVGKLSLTSAATNIPEETLRRWRLQPWWKEMQAEILKSSKIELNGKIMKVIDKSMAVIEDRLENGDFFFNPKTGAFERKGVSANVANKIANDLIQKNVLMDKIITEESVQDEGLEDRLKKLKDEMLRFANAKVIDAEVVKDELVPEDSSSVAPTEVPGSTQTTTDPYSGGDTPGGVDPYSGSAVTPGYTGSPTDSRDSHADSPTYAESEGRWDSGPEG